MFTHRISDHHSLRELSLRDADELFAVVEASRAHLRRWLPWLDHTRVPEDTRRYIENTMRQSERNHGFQAAILFNGQIAGLVGYHRIDWENRHTALGYWLAEDCQGRGLMTASCRVLIDHAFAALNLNRITIACATDNLASRAIPERLGFSHEGTLRGAEWIYDHFVDHEIYGYLQGDWQAQMLQRIAAARRPTP